MVQLHDAHAHGDADVSWWRVVFGDGYQAEMRLALLWIISLSPRDDRCLGESLCAVFVGCVSGLLPSCACWWYWPVLGGGRSEWVRPSRV